MVRITNRGTLQSVFRAINIGPKAGCNATSVDRIRVQRRTSTVIRLCPVKKEQTRRSRLFARKPAAIRQSVRLGPCCLTVGVGTNFPSRQRDSLLAAVYIDRERTRGYMRPKERRAEPHPLGHRLEICATGSSTGGWRLGGMAVERAFTVDPTPKASQAPCRYASHTRRGQS